MGKLTQIAVTNITLNKSSKMTKLEQAISVNVYSLQLIFIQIG